MRVLQTALAFGLIAAASGALAAPQLFSHEASYSVQLARGSLSKGPRGANGTMDLRFVETCSGWETRSRIVMDLSFRDGTTMTNERDFESFESKDGREYRFAARTVKGGTPVEAFRGTAAFKSSGAGSVVYEVPSDEQGGKTRTVTITLPKGTLLPVAHALELLGRAEKGDQLFRSVLFNGASSVGPRMMSTIIGPQIIPLPESLPAQNDIDAGLLTTPSWDLSLAYYNLIDGRRETPTFEVFQRFYASGIAPSFEQEFGDFTIRADLDRLQRIQPEDCAKQ